MPTWLIALARRLSRLECLHPSWCYGDSV
jgi:hypothetical protein